MKRATIDGIDLAYVDRGEGTPVLLIHGFPLDHTMWEAQIDALATKYRVLAPDLRGFGQSVALEQGDWDDVVTMERFADDLAALLQTIEVNRPAVVVGLSMGGYVALEFWRKHTERTKRLVLCDTRAAKDPPEVAAGRLETADQVLRDGAASLAEGMILKLFPQSTITEQPELGEAFRRMVSEADPRGIAAAARGMAERRDMTKLLQQIACPTLLIVGTWDIISPPEEMHAIAEAIPRAQFAEIPGCGHLSAMEKPEAVNRTLLEFLGRFS